MLSRNYHIRDSSFTFIPNPTIDRWDKRSLRLFELLEAYQHSITVEQSKGKLQSLIVKYINKKVQDILQHYPHRKDGGHRRLHFLGLLHSAVDDADEILTGRPRSLDGKTEEYVPGEDDRKEMVQLVLRAHLQEVLRLLNERDVPLTDTQAPQVTESAPDGVTTNPLIRFDAMDDASPDERQLKFMEVYFQVVRPAVLGSVARSTARRASIASRRASLISRRASSLTDFREPQPNNLLAEPMHRRPGSSRSAQASFNHPRNSLALGSETRSQIGEGSSNGDDDELRMPLMGVPPSHEDLWCTLVFRMICWLTLHDIHRLDVQIGKSELWGSRMPVYIS